MTERQQRIENFHDIDISLKALQISQLAFFEFTVPTLETSYQNMERTKVYFEKE